MATPPDTFSEAAEAYGLAFDPGDLDQLQRYLELLLETNRQFNLTAITDPDEAWLKHVFDSLTLLPYLMEAEARTVIDVGSGGGLPGVPLAICAPDVRFTLLEATGKKTRFLETAIESLGLGNVEVVGERAETAGHDRERFREHFDAVTARAVGPLPVLLELTVPFARVDGHVLAIKGGRAADEIEASKTALHLLHAEVVTTTPTPTGTIVVILKRRVTPKIYPRRPGEPKRAPL